jgi:hypothetical protein
MVASTSTSLSPDSVEQPPEAEMFTKADLGNKVEPVWRASLDVSVWRSRPWWLRVVASLVVKRLGR